MSPESTNSKSQDFNSNSYATKKTITQFLVDISLLLTNVSQLKTVIDVGESQQYFILLTTLLSISIILQVLQAIVFLILGARYNITKASNQIGAMIWNDVALSFGVITTILNVMIGVFDVNQPRVVIH